MSFDRINDLDNPIWVNGTRASSRDVECPLCGAAPDEACRTLRGEHGTSYGHGGTTYGNYGHRHIKRPHPERVDAFRSGSPTHS